MTSKREQVLSAIEDLVRRARPLADIERRQEKPARLSPAGHINILDGDLGEPEIDLSPLTYNWRHRVPLQITLPTGVSADSFLKDIGEEVGSDRQLGGLVDWLDVEGPDVDLDDIFGAEALQDIQLTIVAEYATSNPLI